MRTTTLILAACLLLAGQAGAQNFKVQLAAYVDAMPISYFEDLGLKGVYEAIDQNEIHRYYIGEFETRPEAEAMAKTALSKGFLNTQVIDVEEQKALCAAPCPYINRTSTYDNMLFDGLMLQSIFFDFNKADLDLAAEVELDNLYSVLVAYPYYRARINAHTDAKGSAEYNIALSKRRARAASTYLMKKGVESSRIDIKVFGESDPVAKNISEKGEDLPEGRQLNRRVNLIVINEMGEVMSDLVQPIDVPEHLRVGN